MRSSPSPACLHPARTHPAFLIAPQQPYSPAFRALACVSLPLSRASRASRASVLLCCAPSLRAPRRTLMIPCSWCVLSLLPARGACCHCSLLAVRAFCHCSPLAVRAAIARCSRCVLPLLPARRRAWRQERHKPSLRVLRAAVVRVFVLGGRTGAPPPHKRGRRGPMARGNLTVRAHGSNPMHPRP